MYINIQYLFKASKAIAHHYECFIGSAFDAFVIMRNFAHFGSIPEQAAGNILYTTEMQ